MGFFSFLFGNKSNDKRVKLEEIGSRIDPEEGWGDVFLKIVQETKKDFSRIYIAKGLYNNEIVGLKIEIHSNIGAGIENGQVAEETGFVSNAVQISSIGKESDAFITALAALYHQTTNKSFTKKPIFASAFSLNEKAVNLDKQDYYRLKLFFEENNENLYSELFLNINTERQEIELHEKDESYRVNILTVFTN